MALLIIVSINCEKIIFKKISEIANILSDQKIEFLYAKWRMDSNKMNTCILNFYMNEKYYRKIDTGKKYQN